MQAAGEAVEEIKEKGIAEVMTPIAGKFGVGKKGRRRRGKSGLARSNSGDDTYDDDDGDSDGNGDSDGWDDDGDASGEPAVTSKELFNFLNDTSTASAAAQGGGAEGSDNGGGGGHGAGGDAGSAVPSAAAAAGGTAASTTLPLPSYSTAGSTSSRAGSSRSAPSTSPALPTAARERQDPRGGGGAPEGNGSGQPLESGASGDGEVPSDPVRMTHE